MATKMAPVAASEEDSFLPNAFCKNSWMAYTPKPIQIQNA